MSTKHFTGLFALALALGISGCGNSPFEPELTNNTDDLQFQVTGIQDVSEIQVITWKNTGTLANVDNSSTISNGTARLDISDAIGTQVYSRDLADDGTFVTGAGVAGDWTVRVVLTNVSGTLNFRVQRGG